MVFIHLVGAFVAFCRNHLSQRPIVVNDDISFTCFDVDLVMMERATMVNPCSGQKEDDTEEREQ